LGAQVEFWFGFSTQQRELKKRVFRVFTESLQPPVAPIDIVIESTAVAVDAALVAIVDAVADAIVAPISIFITWGGRTRFTG